MAGLVPAIHVFLVCVEQDVDARVKPGMTPLSRIDANNAVARAA